MGQSPGYTVECPGCGAFSYDSDKYCACCGTSLHKQCTSCGAEMFQPVAFFCTECGGRLPGS